MTTERMRGDNFKGCRCCNKTVATRADDNKRAKEEIEIETQVRLWDEGDW